MRETGQGSSEPLLLARVRSWLLQATTHRIRQVGSAVASHPRRVWCTFYLNGKRMSSPHPQLSRRVHVTSPVSHHAIAIATNPFHARIAFFSSASLGVRRPDHARAIGIHPDDSFPFPDPY